MRIQFFCFYSALTGYGRAARDTIAALCAVGHEVQIIDWTSLPGAPLGPPRVSPEPRYQPFDQFVRPWPQDGESGVAIYHAQPRLLARLVDERRLPALTSWNARVAMTTWETSQLPLEYRLPLSEFDAVLVPSSFCKTVMGVDPDDDDHVRVVPHPFCPTFWQPQGLERTDSTCRFYSIGEWSERKNHLAVVRAFLHAFTCDDDVGLFIRSHNANHDQVRSLMARSGIRPQHLPKVSVSADSMDEIGLREIHERADVFVTATRAEGWGLSIFEAAAMGKTIIAPIGSGQDDFLFLGDELRYAGLRPVDSVDTPCFAGQGAPVIQGDRVVGERASITPGMDCRQTWGEPDVLELARRMRASYQQHQAGALFAGTASDRERLVQRFSYQTVGPQLTDLLADVGG